MKDIEKKAADMISKMSGDDLEKKKDDLLNFLGTPAGEKLSASFGGKSDEISAVLRNMSADDITEKLRHADLSRLSQKNIEDILKKLR